MYDLIIIGAGWAGFSAAVEARKRGLKVALIEKNKLGGTCLNLGCIPTKSLVHATEILSLAKNSKKFGIEIENPGFNFANILLYKKSVLDSLGQGMQFLIKAKQIDYIQGDAKLMSLNQISVDSSRTLEARYIIIATGSKPAELANLKFDHKKIINSDDILGLEEVPESMLIIGGGVIGCEFAQIFSRLGCKVTVVELMEQLLPNEDREAAKKIELIFKKTKIDVHTKTDFSTVDFKNFNKILVCVGRTTNTDNLDLEKMDIKTNKNRIIVDEFLRTNIENIFACGDCIGGLMLAHVASYEGRLAVKNMVSGSPQYKVDYRFVPNAIFTEPQIASIGLSEEKAKNSGCDFKISKFNFLSSGMARILDQTEGFVKIISDSNTEDILGAVIVGPQATELINILSVAMHAGIKLNNLSDVIFGHPSISESLIDAIRES